MIRRVASISSLVLPALVFLLSPVASVSGESVLIKRKFTPGTIRYLESKTEVEQNMKGGPMKAKVTRLYGAWEKVVSKSGGKSTVVLTFDRAAHSMDMPMMGKPEYDTDDPDNEEAAPLLASILQPLIGESMTMEVDQGGEVVSFSGMTAINKKISEKAIGNPIWAQMNREFTDEHARQTWGELPLLLFPNKMIAVGETWDRSVSTPTPRFGTVVTEFHFKADDIDVDHGRKSVLISYTGTVATSADSEQGSVTRAKISGTVSGTARFDVESGTMAEHTMLTNTNIKMPMMDIEVVSRTTHSVLTESERNKQKRAARDRAAKRLKAKKKKTVDAKDDEAGD